MPPVGQGRPEFVQSPPHRVQIEGEGEILGRIGQPPQMPFQEEIAVATVPEERLQEFEAGDFGGQHGGLRAALGIFARIAGIPDNAPADSILRLRLWPGRSKRCESPR